MFNAFEQNYTKITDKDIFNDYLHDGGMYVVSFWNPGGVTSGIHTVAFTCDESKNIYVYNRYSNVMTPYKYNAEDGKTGLDLLLEENGGAIVMYEVMG